jgi:hypothetical protein
MSFSKKRSERLLQGARRRGLPLSLQAICTPHWRNPNAASTRFTIIDIFLPGDFVTLRVISEKLNLSSVTDCPILLKDDLQLVVYRDSEVAFFLRQYNLTHQLSSIIK